ncbi:ABC transporter permease subunit [Deinococcus ruber]|uniref:ABC transporter ATP-binding protein n=1 Tax=Deinococcus ruber TaxID=1848197 RepID=A0A918FFL5_9DEIO|nr:ABC transporter permease subunit [Deinococcus ruber]GGR34916.1 ABC transporter ATP-binding protein [Deinococcus ruber]
MTVSADALPAIVLQDVSVRLGGAVVLESLNLSVRRGEFLAIIGPSGGGKSTLLRVIGGLLRVQGGSVTVSTPPAFVFQDYRLLPWRNVRANVRLPADLHGLVPGSLNADEALLQVGMSGFARYYPAQLSGGMRARVALARALAQSSDVLLLDEPFAALDALVRERFNDELLHLHDKTGRTTVLVTHSIREAAYLADRVAVLREGRIVKVLDTGRRGRASAYTEGLEAELRALLGEGDSTRLQTEEPGRIRLGWLWPALSLLLGLALWQVAAMLINQKFLLPAPALVWSALTTNAGVLLPALALTARTALLGVLLGGAAGLLLGYPLGKLPWLERFLSPYLVASQSTPIVVLAPLLVSYLGYGTLSAVIVSALSALYPVLVSAIVGVREVDRGYLELFRSLRSTPIQRLWHLELPGALPILLGGLRLSFSLALIGAVVWEFTDPNQKGIGFQVAQAGVYYNKALQFAGIALLIFLGVAFYLLLTTLERRVLYGRRQR